ncbi:putative queuosine, q, salvage protein family domain-containing protein [Ditylenchus destructor]|nr:putative queuosine, q, salvage protein family domain-containing protein [Ditylenchus destructor]
MVADLLSPRESGVLIAKNATHIKINDDGVRKVANMIHDSVKSGEIASTDYEYFDVHTKASDREAVDWIFFMDVINFSFWTEHDDKWWLVSYKCDDENKGGYSGYFASCACANRALDSGIPLTTAEFMATVTEEKLAEIFTADNGNLSHLDF